jgi:hypothetical protein
MADLSVEGIREALGVNIDMGQLQTNVAQLYNDRPGFFAPYQSGRDFIDTLASPIVIPLGGGLLTGLIAAASGIAAAVCVCSLAAAGIAAGAGKIDSRDTALSVAAISGITTFIAPLLAALVAVFTVLAMMYTLAELVTRTGATIVSPLVNAIKLCLPCGNQEAAADEVDSVEEYTYTMG